MWTKLFKCVKCWKRKWINKFYKSKQKKWFYSECKECMNLRNRRNYLKRKLYIVKEVKAPKADYKLLKLAIAWGIGLLLMGWVVGYLLIG